ncbi:MAG: amphi-Trp domain-containing protein [Pseudomonadota bacterium]|nr:amphi-Trp domain-containing protein [Pseudomonadota bacterium]
MRTSENSFKHESIQDASSIRSLLESITRGLAEGRLTFSDEDGEIVMEPEGLLQLKVTAIREDSHNKISLRISWQAEEKLTQKQNALKVE